MTTTSNEATQPIQEALPLSSGLPTFDRITGGLRPGLTIGVDPRGSHWFENTVVSYAGLLGPSTVPVLVIVDQVLAYRESLAITLAGIRLWLDEGEGDPEVWRDSLCPREAAYLTQARLALDGSAVSIEERASGSNGVQRQIHNWVQRTRGCLVVVHQQGVTQKTIQEIKMLARECNITVILVPDVCWAPTGGLDFNVYCGYVYPYYLINIRVKDELGTEWTIDPVEALNPSHSPEDLLNVQLPLELALEIRRCDQ